MAQFHLKEGSIRNIIGDEPASGYVFDQWTGDVAYLDDPMNRSTNVTMPASDIEVTATYLYIPLANSKYGLLYNFYAATDARKISSSDSFIVPTISIYTNLISAIDPLGDRYYNIAGGKMKESGFIHWDYPNLGADNSSGFTAVGAGLRDPLDGLFYLLNQYTEFWCSDYEPLEIGIVGNPYSSFALDFEGSAFAIDGMQNTTGASIRLCNPNTLNAEGSVNSYTQNDGTIIPTIVTNGVEWTMNLNETKFRNDDWIHGFDGGVYTPISNAVWAAATTEMCCAYNDDTNNI